MLREPPKEVREQIQQSMDKCAVAYANGDYGGTISVLEKAWRLLPSPREEYTDSFYIARGIASTAMKAGQIDKAKEWSNRLFDCDPGRTEIGERDFLAGQVAFAAGEWDLARKHFAIAFKKSEGRCFKGEDPKYLAFYRGKFDPAAPSAFGEQEGDMSDDRTGSFDEEIEGDELDERLYKRIQSIASRGDAKFEKGKYKDAITHYRKAIELLPEPSSRWEASTWLFTALGDAYHAQDLYSAAKEEFYNAANCPGGMQNPYIQMRLGQCQFECGEMERARDSLLRAYMADGRKVFDGEPEEYFDTIRDLVNDT